MALFAITVLLSGCARSAEDIQQEFDDIVTEASTCQTADDCTLI